MSREAFEVFITAPPFEMRIGRFDDRGAWPGSYLSYDVDLAWAAWKEAEASAFDGAMKVCKDLANNNITHEGKISALECSENIRLLKDKS